MHRIAVPALLSVSALLASCGNAPSTTPCTTNCVDISGVYTEDQGSSPTGNPVSCQDGTNLKYKNSQSFFTVTQEGSAITVAHYTAEGESITGVMHDDLTVAFNTVDELGVNENTTGTIKGKLYFVGQVTNGTPPTFAGTQTFVRTADRCTVKQIVSWTKAPQ